ncbi:MAG: hypothetical protein KF889_24440 [Alphaproteobacteria bacterium]|nr:hypothetical protein [Alphaproteobacteria bacterium]MCW5742608.1 hypothetical protein [Alphaproteobacteria bacterium]
MPAQVDELRRRAEEAGRIEAAYRLESRDRLAALEQARVAAYRRVELVDALLRAVAAGEDRATAVDAGVRVLCDMTGWTADDAACEEVREQMAAVADQAWLAAHPGEAGGDVVQAFTRFEAWYASRFQTAFTALVAREEPSLTPLVDF